MNSYLESLFSLKGKVAVVTGGGRGLGKGMAMGLAGAGAEVALVSRTQKELKETVEEIRAKGGKAGAYPADVSKLDQIPALVQSIYRDKGRIDILVNNAGFIIRRDGLGLHGGGLGTPAGCQLKGGFFYGPGCGQDHEGKGGRENHQHPFPDQLHRPRRTPPGMESPGGGLLSMTRTLAMEWAKYRIHVNAVAPGYFKTNQTAPLFADEKRVEWMLSRIPAGARGDCRMIWPAWPFSWLPPPPIT